MARGRKRLKKDRREKGGAVFRWVGPYTFECPRCHSNFELDPDGYVGINSHFGYETPIYCPHCRLVGTGAGPRRGRELDDDPGGA